MYSLRFEGVTDAQKTAIETASPAMNKVAAFATTVGDARISRWFGDDALPGGKIYADFDARRKKMDDYINRKCSSMTFVRKVVGQTVDKALCEHEDMAQMIRGAFKTRGTDGRSYLTESDGFVPSGLRVFILPNFMTSDTTAVNYPFAEQLNTLMHEISHRVISTTDHWYGDDDSLDAAARKDSRTVDCAENWGFFYAELLPFLP